MIQNIFFDFRAICIILMILVIFNDFCDFELSFSNDFTEFFCVANITLEDPRILEMNENHKNPDMMQRSLIIEKSRKSCEFKILSQPFSESFPPSFAAEL